MREENNVITLYRSAEPIEIELPMEDEEIDRILTNIRSAPKNEMVDFHFVLISENKCMTISAQVDPNFE